MPAKKKTKARALSKRDMKKAREIATEVLDERPNNGIAPEKTERTLYKVLVGGKSCHGGNTAWSMPEGKKPGAWMSVEGDEPLRMCSRGFHLTWAPAHWFKQGCEIFEVEVSGVAGEESGDKKVLARHARLVRRVVDVARLASLGILTGEHRVTGEKPGGGEWLATGSAQVTAYGSAQVKAYGSAQVTAYGSAQVTAYGSAQVKAYDSAQVTAYGSAQVKAYGSAQVTATGSAQVTAEKQVTIVVLWGDPKLELSGGAVVVDRRKTLYTNSRPEIRVAGATVSIAEAPTT